MKPTKGEIMGAVAIQLGRGVLFGVGWQVGCETVKATSKGVSKTKSAIGRKFSRRGKKTD